MNKKTGFTLAEVLVTVGLIGVISALTIPTLAYNYRGKVLEQQFRAAYSDIKEIGSRINSEKGDVGTFAYKCVYGKTNCNDPKKARKGTRDWAEAFVKYLPGGGPFNETADSSNNISAAMKKIYKDAGAPQGPLWFDAARANTSPGIVCDNGGIWTDSKGRIYTFNGENQFICVDINGTAAPNRMNIDTFIFKPMTAQEVAIWVYNDPNNLDKYSGQIIPCDMNKISGDNWGNKMPSQTGYVKGSGSAVDWCPFNEPIENIAVMTKDRTGKITANGKSARGKTMTLSNNYWKDYINYK